MTNFVTKQGTKIKAALTKETGAHTKFTLTTHTPTPLSLTHTPSHTHTHHTQKRKQQLSPSTEMNGKNGFYF